MIASCSMIPSAGPCAPGNHWPWLADESPLNDLDDAEGSIDEIDDDVADALAELLDEPAPMADPGTP
jgi:hypothetical protein